MPLRDENNLALSHNGLIAGIIIRLHTVFHDQHQVFEVGRAYSVRGYGPTAFQSALKRATCHWAIHQP